MNKKSAQGGRRQPVLTTNDHGQPIVFVPLANHSRPARIDAKDFEMLLAEGYSDQWNFNQVGQAYGYVRCKNAKVKGGLSTVARLVLGTGQKHVVHYRDGDRLNLCRSNLFVSKGNASGATPCPGPTSGPCGVSTVGEPAVCTRGIKAKRVVAGFALAAARSRCSAASFCTKS